MIDMLLDDNYDIVIASGKISEDNTVKNIILGSIISNGRLSQYENADIFSQGGYIGDLIRTYAQGSLIWAYANTNKNENASLIKSNLEQTLSWINDVYGGSVAISSSLASSTLLITIEATINDFNYKEEFAV